MKVNVITAASARFKHLSFAHGHTLVLPSSGAATLQEPDRLIKGLDLFRIGSGSGSAGKTSAQPAIQKGLKCN